jgi:N-acetyl-alpha-D-muramate 1-phosphate uridylyltransferase
MFQKIDTAMLFAAGLGSRLQPFTLHHPKALAMVGNKSLLQRNVEYLQQFGITNLIVNVHHFAPQIVDVIFKNNGWGSTITISNESNEVLETGGGLKKALPLFANKKTIVVMNVDILTNLNLDSIIDFHFANNSQATLAITNRITDRNLVFDANNVLIGWVNKKTQETKGILPTQLLQNNIFCNAFSGIQVVETSFIKSIDNQGKFSLIDVYINKMKHNKILGFNHSNDILVDVGKPESVLLAQGLFA